MKILPLNNSRITTNFKNLTIFQNGQQLSKEDVIKALKFDEAGRDEFITKQNKKIIPAPDIYELYRISHQTGEKTPVRGEIYFKKTSGSQMCYHIKPTGEKKPYSGMVGELTDEGTKETLYIEGYKRKTEEYHGRALYRTLEYSPKSHSLVNVKLADGSLELTKQDIPNGAFLRLQRKTEDNSYVLTFKTATKREHGSAYLKYENGKRAYVKIDYPKNYEFSHRAREKKLLHDALSEARDVLYDKELRHQFSKNNYLDFQLYELIQYLEQGSKHQAKP